MESWGSMNRAFCLYSKFYPKKIIQKKLSTNKSPKRTLLATLLEHACVCSSAFLSTNFISARIFFDENIKFFELFQRDFLCEQFSKALCYMYYLTLYNTVDITYTTWLYNCCNFKTPSTKSHNLLKHTPLYKNEQNEKVS